MPKFTQTILSIAVHPVGENPVFGEQSTHVSLNDEAGGLFVELFQCADNSESGKVRLDFDEWSLIDSAVKTLMRGAPQQK